MMPDDDTEPVTRLFTREVPEIAAGVVQIKAVARAASYRTKIAVASVDAAVDSVGACVGVRGCRIRRIVDELGSEHIDIVRWRDSLEEMIPNALQPAKIEWVFLYPRLGRAGVLVQEDQLSIGRGRRGHNVLLAGKLVGWDIELLTPEALKEAVKQAETCFQRIPGVSWAVIESFIAEGLFSYSDLTSLKPDELAQVAGFTEKEAQAIILFAAKRVEGENL
jgi:N utilization substance protein A